MTAPFPYRPGEVPEHLTPAEVRALFRVAGSTIRRWEGEGRITAARTPGRHRRYPSAQFAEVIATIAGAGKQVSAA